jgi:DNA mismatch endonuclease (patch repair protein)
MIEIVAHSGKTTSCSIATSRSMRQNRSVNTGPELTIRRALWALGLRGYRKNLRTLPGKPDVVFGKWKVAIFIHGCFWHSCPTCTRNLRPTRNAAYWRDKFERTAVRDQKARDELESLGYLVLVIWECDIRKSLPDVIDQIKSVLTDKSFAKKVRDSQKVSGIASPR